MSEQDGNDPADGHQVFLDLLESSGFFKQIHGLEESLKIIAEELKTFGETAAQRMDEMENLSAHVLAMEATLAVMLKAYPIGAEDLKAEIRDRTAALSGNPEGSPTVHALAANILDKAQTGEP